MLLSEFIKKTITQVVYHNEKLGVDVSYIDFDIPLSYYFDTELKDHIVCVSDNDKGMNRVKFSVNIGNKDE